MRRRCYLSTVVVLTGCSAVAPVPAAPTPAETFMAGLREHCDRAYRRRVLVDQPPADTDQFGGRPLVMHVRECGEEEIRIPFHVGEDRSRTWVVTRTGSGLSLKHEHRHEDGSDDAVTMYGGETAGPGTDGRQELPVDAESIAVFEREGLAASVTNVWAMELDPGRRFLYELSRPGGRLF